MNQKKEFSNYKVVLFLFRDNSLYKQLNSLIGLPEESEYQIFPPIINQKKIIYQTLLKSDEEEEIIETILKNTILEGQLIKIYIVDSRDYNLQQLNEFKLLKLFPQLDKITQYLIVGKKYNNNQIKDILYVDNIQEIFKNINSLQQNQVQLINEYNFKFIIETNQQQQQLIQYIQNQQQQIQNFQKLEDILKLSNMMNDLRQKQFYSIAAKINPYNQRLIIQFVDALKLKFNPNVIMQLTQTLNSIIDQLFKLLQKYHTFFSLCTLCKQLIFSIKKTKCWEQDKTYMLKTENLDIQNMIIYATQTACQHQYIEKQQTVQNKISEKIDYLRSRNNYLEMYQYILKIYKQQQLVQEFESTQQQNSFIVLFGKFGSGKTTIFNKLCQNQQVIDQHKNGLKFNISQCNDYPFFVIDTPSFQRFLERGVEDINLMNSFNQILEGKQICHTFLIVKFQRLGRMKEDISDLIISMDESNQKISIIVTHFDLSEDKDQDQVEIINYINQLFPCLQSYSFFSLEDNGQQILNKIGQIISENPQGKQMKLDDKLVSSSRQIIVQDEAKEIIKSVQIQLKYQELHQFEKDESQLKDVIDCNSQDIDNYNDQIFRLQQLVEEKKKERKQNQDKLSKLKAQNQRKRTQINIKLDQLNKM